MGKNKDKDKGKTDSKEQSSMSNFYKKNKKRKLKDGNSNKAKETLLTPREQLEQKLKHFDLNPLYGPFKGVTRSKRFDLAVKYGLKPPQEIKKIIEENKLDVSFYDKYI